MAEVDIKVYEDRVEEVRKTSQALLKVADTLRENPKLCEYLHISTWLVEEGYMNQYNNVAGKELAILEKYMNCAHVKTQEESDGYDSHKRYYKEVCKNCRKIMKTWDI